jgi:hypothetical protein
MLKKACFGNHPTFRNSHIPGLYLNEGLMKQISIAPDGWRSTLTILVSLLDRTSRHTLSPKYLRGDKPSGYSDVFTWQCREELTRIPAQIVNLQLIYPKQCSVL